MNLSYFVACGLLVTLLSEKMGAKPLTQAQQKSLRSLLGEELAEFLESEEREKRLDAVRSRMRLLRDLRMDTRARGMWARLLNDQPPARKHKSGSKKGGSTSGCFGHKMDRIGTISGMGC
ncbi:C-type natriuretic peptide [Odontesthes bonariensis]|uniref:C-type natriuretic peptide n=1 Tax=Odontesthes bonariensis TaxID=219752 RepID=UPI003F58D1DB